VQVIPLETIGEVGSGCDVSQALAHALETAGLALAPFDILVVTQKIVSKAEGRFVDLAAVVPGTEALRVAAMVRKDPRLVELVLAESEAIVRAVPGVLITRHRSGHVMANAGIDQSNLGGGSGDRVLLLPEHADASADRLRAALERRWSPGFGVVISDSFGRPWRHGVTNVAIGCSGCPALIDRRGEYDRDGRVLEVTQVALGDMVASAAGLVTGEGAEGVPAALVRGLRWSAPSSAALALVRPPDQDLFR
jgi:coenzyme F420-0:L-glutamate ligase/coenzyme F420-1:gamma-L-glutamate ligase